MTLIILVFTYLCGFLTANIMVVPSRAEIKADKPITQVFTIYNRGEKPIKISVEPYYKKTETDLLLDPSTAGKDDLTPYIKIAPKIIRVGSKKPRTIRVSIRPTEELKAKPGEYKVHVMFKNIDVTDPEVQKAQEKREKAKGKEKNISLSGQIKVNVAVPIYASVGKGEPELKVECYTEDDVPTIKAINNGKWRFDGWLEFYSEKEGKDDKALSKSRVFLTRGSFRKIKYEAKMSPVPMRTVFVPLDKNKSKIDGPLCVFKEKRLATKNKKEEQKETKTELKKELNKKTKEKKSKK